MKRKLTDLSNRTFDLLIVGGGVVGLAAAREAAARGLATALVEKGDFGGGTSANSLKLIHGGLRYLQHADIGRLRQSVRERRAFMRMAPHLVHPLPFLVPTYGHLVKSREAMSVAFLLYNLLACDRNRLADPEKRIPGGRIVSAGECLKLFPGFRKEGLTGGAVFHDGQVHNIERLTLSFALGAERAGAALANYARAVGFLREGGRVAGASVRDELTGRELEVRAGVVMNMAGPWADGLLGRLGVTGGSGYLLAKAVNIVVPRLLSASHAVGLESRGESSDALVGKGGRLFFVTPWRGVSVIGTTYHTYRGDPDRMRVTAGDVAELVEGINGAWPGAGLKPEEVTFFHAGLVPITAETGPSGANLAKADRIIDHAAAGGPEGLVSVVGVKYTTARDVAETAVRIAFRKMGKEMSAAPTAETPLPGGEIDAFTPYLEKAVAGRAAGLGEAAARHLVYSYGSDHQRIIGYGREDAGWLANLPGSREVLRAEILHGVREEMAVKLADAVMRRTDLGAMGHPGEDCLGACADIMAGELGWDGERKRRELDETREIFRIVG